MSNKALTYVGVVVGLAGLGVGGWVLWKRRGDSQNYAPLGVASPIERVPFVQTVQPAYQAPPATYAAAVGAAVTAPAGGAPSFGQIMQTAGDVWKGANDIWNGLGDAFIAWDGI